MAWQENLYCTTGVCSYVQKHVNEALEGFSSTDLI